MVFFSQYQYLHKLAFDRHVGLMTKILSAVQLYGPNLLVHLLYPLYLFLQTILLDR